MIIPPLLTNKNFQPEGYSLIGSYVNPFSDNHHYILYLGNGLFVFQSLQIGVTVEARGQVVMPLIALPWVIDCVENKFWLKPSLGGLPKNVHFVQVEIEGENLAIQRCMNAGAEGEMGFSIDNKSRASYIAPRNTQHGTISDNLLKEKIFPDLKKILPL